MPLSWNEIKTRALAFSKEWEHESSEEAETESFCDSYYRFMSSIKGIFSWVIEEEVIIP